MLKAEAYRNIKLSSIKLETGHLKQESPITSVSLIFEAGHPEPVLCNNLEGWGGEGGGWGCGFKMEGHMYAYGQFTLMYGKNHHNTVK